MPMKYLSTDNIPTRKIVQAFLITMTVAVVFHLVVVSITAIIKRHISYLNPLDFLGLSIVWPQYRDSPVAAFSGWMVIFVIFGVTFYLTTHYHLYLALIRETKVGKKFTQVTNKLQSKSKPNAKSSLVATKRIPTANKTHKPIRTRSTGYKNSRVAHPKDT